MKLSIKSIVWCMCFLVTYWLFYTIYKIRNCSDYEEDGDEEADAKISLAHLNNEEEYDHIYNMNDELVATEKTTITYRYNRNLPIIFIVGIQGSGLNLMRQLLDENPYVRCGEDTEIISSLINRRFEWTKSKIEKERLDHASMTDDVIDAAIAQFILEVMLKQGEISEHLCNKDPQLIHHINYLKQLFPKIKFVLMIRDPRATVTSIIDRGLTVNGIEASDHIKGLISWNKLTQEIYGNCKEITADSCMPVFFEQLTLETDKTMKKILKFLNVSPSLTQNDNKNINNVSTNSKNRILRKKELPYNKKVKIKKDEVFNWYKNFPTELLSQVSSLAPMLTQLGYNTSNQAPTFFSYKKLLSQL